MTVKEAKEYLEKFDEDMDIKIFCGTTNEVVTEVFEDTEDGGPVFSY